jgi:hypothetical protein
VHNEEINYSKVPGESLGAAAGKDGVSQKSWLLTATMRMKTQSGYRLCLLHNPTLIEVGTIGDRSKPPGECAQ